MFDQISIFMQIFETITGIIMGVLLQEQFRSNPRKSDARKHLSVPSTEGFSVVNPGFRGWEASREDFGWYIF